MPDLDQRCTQMDPSRHVHRHSEFVVLKSKKGHLMWRVEPQMVKRAGALAPPKVYLCTCLDPSVGVRGGLQNGALRRPELRADRSDLCACRAPPFGAANRPLLCPSRGPMRGPHGVS